MFNNDSGSNVRGYAVAGSFDDCQRLVKEAFADKTLRRQIPLTSANSINVGRLLPQMIYYFQAVAELRRTVSASDRRRWSARQAGTSATSRPACWPGARARLSSDSSRPPTSTTSCRQYLATGQFRPRASVRTIANAMDVGNPSNFERLLWLYDGSLEAARHDIAGCHYEDDEVRATRSGRCTTGAATSSIPTRRLATSGSRGRADGQRAGQAGRSLSRDSASGEVSGDRRTGDRALDREAGGRWRWRCRKPLENSSPRRDARGRQGRRWRLIVRYFAIGTMCSRSCGRTACGPPEHTPPDLVRVLHQRSVSSRAPAPPGPVHATRIPQTRVSPPRGRKCARSIRVLALRPRQWLIPSALMGG